MYLTYVLLKSIVTTSFLGSEISYVPPADDSLTSQIVAWAALVIMAPLAFLATPYKLVWNVIPEYIETYTFAIPYWVSSYLSSVLASYMSLLGLYLISVIQGAAGLTPGGSEAEAAE